MAAWQRRLTAEQVCKQLEEKSEFDASVIKSALFVNMSDNRWFFVYVPVSNTNSVTVLRPCC